jgi:acyl-coenzyme A synthetase/AMP-(fatty) acid ligase
MSADYIAFHATERPDAVALVDRGRPITFSDFDRDLRKLTRAVADLGVRKSGSVAVGADDLYIHWLLLLAFERVGIAAASLHSGEGEATLRALANVDLALTEPHFARVAGVRHHLITRDWLDRVLANEREPDEHFPARFPDDPVRILRTSGTTGTPKRILHSRSLHEAWATRWIVMTGLSRRTRLLLTMSFSVNGMYACATACLRAGGTVVSADMPEARDVAQAIADHAITALILAPFQIGRVLDALPSGFVKPRGLTLCSFGAAVSNALRQRALERLATELIDMYGSNEAGFIASTRGSGEDGVSTIWPGVRVEIVDERDAPLPRGQAGRIRVRTPDMVQSYIGDPAATRRMFRDGWFYPGDLGILQGAHELRILGRGDDLLNFGGHKLPPEALERAILAAVTLGDVGVCSVPNSEGIEQLLIGLVDAPSDDRTLTERLSAALMPFRAGSFRAARLAEIPRNANGKIRRDLLKRAILDTLRSSPQVTL